MIDAAVANPTDEDYWELPAHAVNLDGGNNYGSGLYDALVDGVMIRVIICDDCLREHRDLIQEYKVEEVSTRRRVVQEPQETEN